MGFERRTLTSLRAEVRADYQAGLPGADALLQQSNLRVMGDVKAGLAHGLYGYLGWLAEQVLPDRAEWTWLERWAALFGLERRAANAAEGVATFSGQVGALVPAGLPLQTSGGARFETLAGGTIAAGGNANVAIRAVTAGAGGNQTVGVTLSLVEAVAGVNATALIAANVTGGVDEESDESLRARLLFRMALPPQGGAEHDYEHWAREVPGVTRVWVKRKEMGAGTVTVRFMMDELRASEQGIPQGAGAPAYSGDLALVADHFAGPRPVTADVFVVAPIPVPLDLTITGLSPDTPAIRAAIEAEVKDMLFRDAVPGGIIRRSRLGEAVSIATGEVHHSLTLPAGDVVHGVGEIAVMGAVTYV